MTGLQTTDMFIEPLLIINGYICTFSTVTSQSRATVNLYFR